jgi:hypothetical protein
VFVILVGIEKGALLLFGAAMAFATRNVKGTFNESTSISFSIYNTLLMVLIAGGIIGFLRAVEDTLLTVVLVLLAAIVYMAWGLIFGQKFHLLFRSDQEMLEASRSDIAQEKSNGFSFASIAVMTVAQVKQYYVALKMQVNKAERQLHVPLTAWSAASNQVGASVTGDANNNSDLHTRSSGGTIAYDADTTAVKDREVERERTLLNRGSPGLIARKPASAQTTSYSRSGGVQPGGNTGFRSLAGVSSRAPPPKESSPPSAVTSLSVQAPAAAAAAESTELPASLYHQGSVSPVENSHGSSSNLLQDPTATTSEELASPSTSHPRLMGPSSSMSLTSPPTPVTAAAVVGLYPDASEVSPAGVPQGLPTPPPSQPSPNSAAIPGAPSLSRGISDPS